MTDDGPGEQGSRPEGPGQRRWNWGAGIALGLGVGVAFGAAFIPSLGGFGIAIGLMIGAGLAPAFAMSTSRPANANRGPGGPEQDPREHG